MLDQDDVVLVEKLGSNGIYFHTNTAEVDSLRGLIIEKIKLSIETIGKVIEVKDVEFRVMVFPERTIPTKGMSGAAPNKKQIYILLAPSHPRLEKTLREYPQGREPFRMRVRTRAVGTFSGLCLGAVLGASCAWLALSMERRPLSAGRMCLN